MPWAGAAHGLYTAAYLLSAAKPRYTQIASYSVADMPLPSMCQHTAVHLVTAAPVHKPQRLPGIFSRAGTASMVVATGALM
jgi:hypothetical protein